MNLTTMITTGIAATALLAGPVALATPATAAIPAHATTAVQAAPTVKAFPERTIKVRGLVKETRYDHDGDIVEVLRVTQTRQTVTIRGTSKGVQAKVGGKWRYIPYTYNPRTGTLTYNDDVRRDLGITKDQLTGVNVVTKPKKPRPTATPEPTTPPAEVPAYVTDPQLNRAPADSVLAKVGVDWKEQLLARFNAMRAEGGLPPLQMCDAVNRAAQWKSNDSADLKRFAHGTPTGDVYEVLKGNGLAFPQWGEILGRGSSSANRIADAWRDSSSHRQIIMRPENKLVGFGLQQDSQGTVYWTSLLVSSTNECPAPNQVSVPAYVTDPTLNRAPDSDAIARVGADWKGELLSGLNRLRTEKGLTPFTMCEASNRIGQWRANDMAATGYYSHLSKSGNVMDVIQNAGLTSYGYSTENIVAGRNDAASAVSAWRNSPNHYAAIIKPDFTVVGLGVQMGADGRLYWDAQLISGTC